MKSIVETFLHLKTRKLLVKERKLLLDRLCRIIEDNDDVCRAIDRITLEKYYPKIPNFTSTHVASEDEKLISWPDIFNFLLENFWSHLSKFRNSKTQYEFIRESWSYIERVLYMAEKRFNFLHSCTASIFCAVLYTLKHESTASPMVKESCCLKFLQIWLRSLSHFSHLDCPPEVIREFLNYFPLSDRVSVIHPQLVGLWSFVGPSFIPGSTENFREFLVSWIPKDTFPQDFSSIVLFVMTLNSFLLNHGVNDAAFTIGHLDSISKKILFALPQFTGKKDHLPLIQYFRIVTSLIGVFDKSHFFFMKNHLQKLVDTLKYFLESKNTHNKSNYKISYLELCTLLLITDAISMGDNSFFDLNDFTMGSACFPHSKFYEELFKSSHRSVYWIKLGTILCIRHPNYLGVFWCHKYVCELKSYFHSDDSSFLKNWKFCFLISLIYSSDFYLTQKVDCDSVVNEFSNSIKKVWCEIWDYLMEIYPNIRPSELEAYLLSLNIILQFELVSRPAVFKSFKRISEILFSGYSNVELLLKIHVHLLTKEYLCGIKIEDYKSQNSPSFLDRVFQFVSNLIPSIDDEKCIPAIGLIMHLLSGFHVDEECLKKIFFTVQEFEVFLMKNEGCYDLLFEDTLRVSSNSRMIDEKFDLNYFYYPIKTKEENLHFSKLEKTKDGDSLQMDFHCYFVKKIIGNCFCVENICEFIGLINDFGQSDLRNCHHWVQTSTIDKKVANSFIIGICKLLNRVVSECKDQIDGEFTECQEGTLQKIIKISYLLPLISEYAVGYCDVHDYSSCEELVDGQIAPLEILENCLGILKKGVFGILQRDISSTLVILRNIKESSLKLRANSKFSTFLEEILDLTVSFTNFINVSSGADRSVDAHEIKISLSKFEKFTFSSLDSAEGQQRFEFLVYRIIIGILDDIISDDCDLAIKALDSLISLLRHLSEKNQLIIRILQIMARKIPLLVRSEKLGSVLFEWNKWLIDNSQNQLNFNTIQLFCLWIIITNQVKSFHRLEGGKEKFLRFISNNLTVIEGTQWEIGRCDWLVRIFLIIWIVEVLKLSVNDVGGPKVYDRLCGISCKWLLDSDIRVRKFSSCCFNTVLGQLDARYHPEFYRILIKNNFGVLLKRLAECCYEDVFTFLLFMVGTLSRFEHLKMQILLQFHLIATNSNDCCRKLVFDFLGLIARVFGHEGIASKRKYLSKYLVHLLVAWPLPLIKFPYYLYENESMEEFIKANLISIFKAMVAVKPDKEVALLKFEDFGRHSLVGLRDKLGYDDDGNNFQITNLKCEMHCYLNLLKTFSSSNPGLCDPFIEFIENSVLKKFNFNCNDTSVGKEKYLMDLIITYLVGYTSFEEEIDGSTLEKGPILKFHLEIVIKAIVSDENIGCSSFDGLLMSGNWRILLSIICRLNSLYVKITDRDSENERSRLIHILLFLYQQIWDTLKDERIVSSFILTLIRFAKFKSTITTVTECLKVLRSIFANLFNREDFAFSSELNFKIYNFLLSLIRNHEDTNVVHSFGGSGKRGCDHCYYERHSDQNSWDREKEGHFIISTSNSLLGVLYGNIGSNDWSKSSIFPKFDLKCLKGMECGRISNLSNEYIREIVLSASEGEFLQDEDLQFSFIFMLLSTNFLLKNPDMTSLITRILENVGIIKIEGILRKHGNSSKNSENCGDSLFRHSLLKYLSAILNSDSIEIYLEAVRVLSGLDSFITNEERSLIGAFVGEYSGGEEVTCSNSRSFEDFTFSSIMNTKCEDWIKIFCSQLAEMSKDDFICQFASLCRIDCTFSEMIFPYILFTSIANYDVDLQEKSANYISKCFGLALNHTELLEEREGVYKFLLKSLNRLLGFDHFGFNTPSMVVNYSSLHDQTFWKFLNFHELAQIALKLNFTFSSWIFAEIYCEKFSSRVSMDNWDSKINSDLFMSIFSRVDDYDVIYGIDYFKLTKRNLFFQLKRLKYEKNWLEIISLFEDSDVFCGVDSIGDGGGSTFCGEMLSALQFLGCNNLSRCCIDSIELRNAGMKYPLSEYRYHTMWRTGSFSDDQRPNWGLLDRLTNRSESKLPFNEVLYEILAALSSGRLEFSNELVNYSRIWLFGDFCNASLESQSILIPILLKLQAFMDVQSVQKIFQELCYDIHCHHESMSNMKSESCPDFTGNMLLQLCGRWNEEVNIYVERFSNYFEHLEPFLFMRNELISVSRRFVPVLKDLQIDYQLKVSEISRKFRYFNTSLMAISHASKLECNHLVLEEKAKLLWNQKNHQAAVETLKEAIGMIPGEEVERSCLLYARLGKWLYKAKLASAYSVRTDYLERAVRTLSKNFSDPDKRAKAYFAYAKFADSQYRAGVEFHESKDWKWREELEREIGRDESKSSNSRGIYFVNLEYNTEEYHKVAFDAYFQVLLKSSLYDLESVFRLFELWCDGETDYLSKEVLEKMKYLKPAKFLPIFYQLTSRLSTNKNSAFQESLSQLTIYVSQSYPYRTLYRLFALSKNDNASNKESVRYIIDKISSLEFSSTQKYQARYPLKRIVRDVEKVMSLYHYLAGLKMKNDETIVVDLNASPFDLGGIRVPIVTFNWENDLDDGVPWIRKFGGKIRTLSGINFPRVVKCYSTDGRCFEQLVKGNDDLKQDAIMMQLFRMVNSLLKVDLESGRRDLSLRTYQVIPMGPKAGVVEWIANTLVIKDYLIAKHAECYPNEWSISTCRDFYGQFVNGTSQEKLDIFEKILVNFSPVFHYFFLEAGRTPNDWFNKRMMYSRSMAVSSMVGYLVGLGDRHPANILVDKKSGELIHIDFGIAFDEGKMLRVPELIPFRLTNNFVDGMGIMGTKGVFKRCSECVLRVLRRKSDNLVTIIRMLLYDPLHTWDINTNQRARRMQGMENKTVNLNFEKISHLRNRKFGAAKLLNFKQKIQGLEGDCQISVEGQVQKLILESTDPWNLSKMYLGWLPWV